MVADIRGTDDYLYQTCQIQDYQNNDWLSLCRIFSLQLKPKLCCTKPSLVQKVLQTYLMLEDRHKMVMILYLFAEYHCSLDSAASPYFDSSYQIKANVSNS